MSAHHWLYFGTSSPRAHGGERGIFQCALCDTAIMLAPSADGEPLPFVGCTPKARRYDPEAAPGSDREEC